MHPERKRRLITILLIVAGLGAALGLTLKALQENINHFYSPGQLVGVKAGERIRLGGMVKTGSLVRSEESLDVSFVVFDDQAEAKVIYTGILPDLFREGQAVVADGIWSGEHMKAEQVLAKHDENYIPPELADQHKKDKAGAADAYSEVNSSK